MRVEEKVKCPCNVCKNRVGSDLILCITLARNGFISDMVM